MVRDAPVGRRDWWWGHGDVGGVPWRGGVLSLRVALSGAGWFPCHPLLVRVLYSHLGVFSHPGPESSGSLPGSVLQGKMKSLIFLSPKHSGLARLGLYIPFPLSYSWLEWEFGCGRHVGPGTAARVSETARPSRGAIRCSAALGRGLRAARGVSRDPS